jgi:hypothetical protein
MTVSVSVSRGACGGPVGATQPRLSLDSEFSSHANVQVDATDGPVGLFGLWMPVVHASHRLVSAESDVVASDGVAGVKALAPVIKQTCDPTTTTKPAFGGQRCEIVLLAQIELARAPPADQF